MTTKAEAVLTPTRKKLEGKIALVTGSSRGIGAGIALRLASYGATVALNYSKNKGAADQIASKITAAGQKAAVFGGSVSSTQEANQLVKAVIEKFGRIDILVNNAGVWEMAPIEKLDAAHYDRVFDVNVKGVMNTTIAALPHISDNGRIINISSVAAYGTIAGGSVYCASKAALNAFTRIWAQDLGARKITVNGVAPGTTETDMLMSGSEEFANIGIEKTALKRLGQPDDIAEVVAFLASDEGRWITGQTITADGGLAL